MHYGVLGMKLGVRKQRVASGKTNHRYAKNKHKGHKRNVNKEKASNVKDLVVAGLILAVAARPIVEMSAQYASTGVKIIADMAGFVDHTTYDNLGRATIELAKHHYKVY